MGEAYRGLTIKFGGDTSELRRALSGVNSAIRSVQSDMKRLNRALDLDPGSTDAVSMKMGLLRERSEDARVEILTLRQALARMDEAGVSKAAESVRNVALNADRANKRYNEVNATLERVNDRFEAIARANGLETKGKQASQVADELHELGMVTDEAYESYRRLADAHNRFAGELETAKAVEQMRKYEVQLAEARAESESLARSLQDVESAAGSGSAVSGGLKRVKDALEDSDRAAKALADELEAVERGLKLDPTSTELLAKRTRNLNEQVAVSKNRLRLLNEEIGNLKSSGIDDAGRSMKELSDAVDVASERYRDLVKRAGDAAAEVDSLRTQMAALEAKDDLGDSFRELAAQAGKAEARVEELNAEARRAREAFDMARASKELRELETQADEARASVKSLQEQLSRNTRASFVDGLNLDYLGMQLSMGVTNNLQQGLGFVVDSAETIDAAFRDMKKTVNGTEEEFQALRDAALEYSKTHITSADTILEIEAMGGQLGIAADQLEDFATVVSNLDIATNMDADEIAESMGQLDNVLGWVDGDMERFGDALVRLGNNMPAQESAIMDITTRIGAAGHMYGMTTPEILSWATAVASTGQNSEAAGTAISNTMAKIEGDVADGGESLQKLADIAGMSADEFKHLWETNASDAFLSFIKGLARIDSEGRSVTNTLSDIGITAVRQRQAIEGLTTTTDVLRDSLKMSEDAWNGVDDQWGDAGDAAREAAQKSEGFSGAIGILRNNMAALGDELGDALIPFIEALTDIVASATDALDAMPDSVKTSAVAIAGLAAAAGPVLNIAGFFQQLGKGAESAAGGVEKLTGKQRILKGVATGLKGGLVGLATAGLGVFVDYVADGIDHANKLEQATKGLEEAVSGPIIGDVSNLSDEIGDMGTSAADAKETVDELIESQAQLSQAIEERHSGLQKSNAALEEYARTVGSLAGKNNLGEDDVARLQIAVDGLNDSLGTNYEVVQSQDGAYRVMADGADVATESIMDLVDAMQLQAAMEVYQQDYEDMLGQRSEALDAVAEAQEAVNEAQEKYDSMSKPLAGVSDEWDAIYRWQAGLTQANTALDEAQQSLDSCDASIQRVNEQMVMLQTAMNSGDIYAEFVANNQEFAAGLDFSKNSLIGLRDALSQTGISVEQLSTLSSQQMVQLASQFDGSAQSIIASLVAMNGGTEENLAALQTCFDENGVGIAESLYAFAETLRASGLESAASYVQSFADSLSGSAEQAGQAAEQVADAAAAGTETGVDPAGDAGEATADEYASSVEDGSGDAQSAGETVASSAVDGLSTAADGAYQAGIDFDSGFANGIYAGQYLSDAAAAAVASSAVANARAALDEHSPSRVAREIGTFFSKGTALGILDGQPDVEAASRKVHEAAAMAAQWSAAAMGTADTASSVAYRAQRASSGGSSRQLTKTDVYDAFSAALASASNRGGSIAVYVDGRELSRSIARHMDAELGNIESRRSR